MVLISVGEPAVSRSPLLMEGKQTLFQRILVRPEAELHATPGQPSADQHGLRAFDVLYVFDRAAAQGADWLEVGRSVEGPTIGWLPEEATAEWKQTIVASFSNSAGRGRSLVFDSAEVVKALWDRRDREAAVATLREQALASGAPNVVSIEPKEPVDILEQFYLLPILDHTEYGSDVHRDYTTALQIASVAEQEPATQLLPEAAPYSLGVVFVIDTTISMKNFIELTRDAIKRFYARFANSPQAENISYGVIGFRNSLERAPKIQYLTRDYLRLERNQQPDEVLRVLAQVEEAPASTGPQLEEDIYAGVFEAIEGIDWTPFAGRLVVVITDSGPLMPEDRFRSLDLDARALSELAHSKNIALHTFFLEPPPEKLQRPIYQQMVAPAMTKLQQLSGGLASDQGSRFSLIERSSVEQFASSVNRLIEVAFASVTDSIDAQEAALAEERDHAARGLRLDTLAMRLADLGSRQGSRAPTVIEGWLADQSLDNPYMKAVDVRLLVSKNELSSLRDVLTRIVSAGHAARLDPSTFFERIRAAMAVMSREPGGLVNTEFDTLAAGVTEYIEDLPYTSVMLGIDEDQWVQMSATRQRLLLATLESKLKAFDYFHDNPDLWTPLYAGAPPGETVYPMSLTAMP